VSLCSDILLISVISGVFKFIGTIGGISIASSAFAIIPTSVPTVIVVTML